jgi:hypothetical protein
MSSSNEYNIVVSGKELRETANLHTILDIQWKLLILVDYLIERLPAFVKHHNPHGAPFLQLLDLSKVTSIHGNMLVFHPRLLMSTGL